MKSQGKSQPRSQGPLLLVPPEQEREQAGLFILPLLDSFGKGTEHLNMELNELNVNKGNFNFFPLEVINWGKNCDSADT